MMVYLSDPVTPEPVLENVLEFMLVFFLASAFWKRVIVWKSR